METDSRPGTMSGEVEWLDADQALRAGPLFDRFFAGSYAKPGASAHRWAEVVAEPDGEPLAVAADAWSARGCGYLAGVVTHPDARGRGLSRAVCGFVLDTLVERHGRAALMADADNATAITTYRRLGMTGRLFRAMRLRTARGPTG